MFNLKNNILFIIILFSCVINNTYAQSSYCTPINSKSNNTFFISKVSFGDIFQNSDNTASVYEYYNTLSTHTDVNLGQDYPASISYRAPNYNTSTLKVWIDFNKDGDFSDSGEEVYTNTVTEPFSEDGVQKDFQINIPTTATTGKTRMRVAINRKNISNACNAEHQAGEMEDYDIYIKDEVVAPIANCVGSINISLDALGNASITAEDINNGSYDAYDTPNGLDLHLSLDKYNFSCQNVSTPTTVTLTVVDSDGLSSTCTSTVNVTSYTGNFVAPTLEDIKEYCSYTAATPVMNLNCTQEITATTTDDTTFNSPGSYTIDWVFDNGTTTKTSTQNITIQTPTLPTISITNISETTAIVRWESEDTDSFIVQYRLNGTTAWNEITSTLKYVKITGLDDGLEYDVQVKTASTCDDSYTGTATFNTVDVEYCDDNVDIEKNNKYYISNVHIGNINNSSDSNADVYKYYKNVSTNIVAGETFSGELTYTRDTYNNTFVTVWIDYNNNGDFSDPEDEIFSAANPADINSVFNIALTNILVPETAALGKTRLRVSIKHNATPSTACNFDSQIGEIEDYDIYIGPIDNTAFESAMITQVLNYNETDRWIEVTNTNLTETIPANKVALALFKNVSGDQTGVTPSSTFFINSEIAPGATVLIKKPTSTFTSTGITIEETQITDFGDGDDIIITTKKTDNTAWENRYDVVSYIKNNTSLVRIDETMAPNKNYNSAEWVEFIDDDITPYQTVGETDVTGTKRHSQDPLISEIEDSNSEANTLLGLHKLKETTTNIDGTWDNGFPDRSRSVVIDQNFEHSVDRLSARTLEISTNKTLTVTDQLLVVTNNITLNGNIRLKGPLSQLVQTHSSTSMISGTGKLLIDQKSMVPSLYRYNYMSSPVTSGTNTYTLKDVLRDGTDIDNPKIINFKEGYDGATTDPISLAKYWIYTYSPATNGRSNWEHQYDNLPIKKGDGYIFKGPGKLLGQNYTFIGTPNDGDFDTALPIGAGQDYLIGNPFPSAMNARKFIEDNSTITGTLYFWEHHESKLGEVTGINGHIFGGYVGGYATVNLSMGLKAADATISSNVNNGTSGLGNDTYTKPEAYIAVGQGFFIEGGTGGAINFNNSQRAYVPLADGESVFYKTNTKSSKTATVNTSNLLPIIKLGLDYKNKDDLLLHHQIGISFDKTNSFNFDRGYDSELYETNETAVYWKFPNNDTKYVIAGVQAISDHLEVPLEITMGYSGTVDIMVDEIQNVSNHLFLTDKLTSESYNITDGKITLTLDKGVYTDRFVLAFATNSALSIEEDSLSMYTNIYADNENHQIVISKNNEVNITNVELFDILGKKVNLWEITEQKNTYQLEIKNKILTGIYIVKIDTDKGTMNKKIVIE